MARRPLVDRRKFLAGSAGAMGAAFFRGAPLDALTSQIAPPQSQTWDAGQVRHLLPTVSESRILLKVSFEQALSATPTLRVGARSFPGRMNDTGGRFWQFSATDLDAGAAHSLSLVAANGSSLCEPWTLSTFPPADARPDRFRLLFFTCAGGPEGTYTGIGQRRGNLPTAIRNRLLRRALSFNPDAAVANGDHIYWDLHRWSGQLTGALSPRAETSSFDFSGSVFGTSNEAALMLAAGPQIVPVYGTDFRSTPVFFLQDDHDHWENDAAGAFPIAWFQLQLARATQQLYYPEFLPEANRPFGLPWSSSSDRGDLSESFGTIRYGTLAEVLLYDVRRTMTLGPTAIFVDANVEEWLVARTTSPGVRHVAHAPSNPFGWSAGKWGEWYPDVLEAGALTTAVPKPYWQDGWAQAARPAGGRDIGHAGPRTARHQRRPPRDRRRQDAPFRDAGPFRKPRDDRTERSGRHVSRRLPVGGSRRRLLTVLAPRSGRDRATHRAARLHSRGFPTRPDGAEPVPVGREQSAARRDRQLGAVLHHRVEHAIREA